MQYLASTCMIHASICKLVFQCLNECEEDVIETQAQQVPQTILQRINVQQLSSSSMVTVCVALQESLHFWLRFLTVSLWS